MNTQIEMPPSPRKLKSSKEKPKVLKNSTIPQKDPMENSTAITVAKTLGIIVGISLIITAGCYLKCLSHNSTLEVKPKISPSWTSTDPDNFSVEKERVRIRRSSPITTIGLEPSKQRDPSRWNLNNEDLGNIAQQSVPEGKTVKKTPVCRINHNF
jgi:hypothetical protein